MKFSLDLMSSYQFPIEPVVVPKVRTNYRLINTPIPAPGTKDILGRLSRVESRSMHGQLPIVWNKAYDYIVEDIAGNRWIDFTSTIFVSNVGHSNKRVAAAIKESLDNPLLSCYAYANPVRANYIEKLVKFAGQPFEKAFLMSSGTEATEAALKLMRMYGEKKGKRRRGIICIQNNWHGRTMGAQMMSSNPAQSSWIGFQDENIHHIPFPYPWSLEKQSGSEFFAASIESLCSKGIDLSKDICGFMLETFQGWGAVFYPKEFVQSIRKLCDENNILMTFDEMQAGFARTGKNFGFEHYEVLPDLICTGKGMGGGVPVSGVIGRAEIMDLPDVGNMSSTHSANPLVTSAGSAVIDEIVDRNLVSETCRKGSILRSGLEQIQSQFPERVSYVMGQGLIMAILFKKPSDNAPDGLFASKVSQRCMEKGLLVVHTGRESIKIGPPLVISDDALLEGISVLRESIAEIAAT